MWTRIVPARQTEFQASNAGAPVRVSFWIGSEECFWFGPGTTRRPTMDLLAIAAVSLFLSCLTGFAWGRHQALRSGARRGDWLCLACGQLARLLGAARDPAHEFLRFHPSSSPTKYGSRRMET